MKADDKQRAINDIRQGLSKRGVGCVENNCALAILAHYAGYEGHPMDTEFYRLLGVPDRQAGDDIWLKNDSDATNEELADYIDAVIPVTEELLVVNDLELEPNDDLIRKNNS
jgi:hypothetical protein